MKITIEFQNEEDNNFSVSLLEWLQKAVDKLEFSMSHECHAAHLQTYAEILERDGDEDEARLLRDAAAIVESWGNS